MNRLDLLLVAAITLVLVVAFVTLVGCTMGGRSCASGSATLSAARPCPACLAIIVTRTGGYQ